MMPRAFSGRAAVDSGGRRRGFTQCGNHQFASLKVRGHKAAVKGRLRFRWLSARAPGEARHDRDQFDDVHRFGDVRLKAGEESAPPIF